MYNRKIAHDFVSVNLDSPGNTPLTSDELPGYYPKKLPYNIDYWHMILVVFVIFIFFTGVLTIKAFI